MKLARWMAVAFLLAAAPSIAQAQESVLQVEAAYQSENYEQARALLLPLAQKGHTQAQYNLGVLYRDGQGGPVDFDAAVMWFEAAARSGFAPAQNNLGSLYLEGRGPAVNYVMAYYWFDRARSGRMNTVIRRAAESNLTYVMSLMTQDQIELARELSRQSS